MIPVDSTLYSFLFPIVIALFYCVKSWIAHYFETKEKFDGSKFITSVLISLAVGIYFSFSGMGYDAETATALVTAFLAQVGGINTVEGILNIAITWLASKGFIRTIPSWW